MLIEQGQRQGNEADTPPLAEGGAPARRRPAGRGQGRSRLRRSGQPIWTWSRPKPLLLSLKLASIHHLWRYQATARPALPRLVARYQGSVGATDRRRRGGRLGACQHRATF